MYKSFPNNLLPLLRCEKDLGSLSLERSTNQNQERVANGYLRCVSCGRAYPVRDGIVSLLDENSLGVESSHERLSRDKLAESSLDELPSDDDEYAIGTKLSLLAPFGGVCLEMGCGSGRLTVLIADKFASTLAVDFSEAFP